MRIYKIAHRNPIDIASNILAKKLLDLIRKLYSENRLFSQAHREKTTTLQYAGFETPISAEIKIDVEIGKNNYNAPFRIEAKYSSRQPNPTALLYNPNLISIERKMIVFIRIYQNFSQNNLNDFYMNSVIVLRHELQHMVQDQQKFMQNRPIDYNSALLSDNISPANRFEEMGRYLSSMFEQEPFIRGFMLQCKKQKRPVLEMIKNFIHDNLFTRDNKEEKLIKDRFGLQAEHMEQLLLELYIRRTKEIFPKSNMS